MSIRGNTDDSCLPRRLGINGTGAASSSNVVTERELAWKAVAEVGTGRESGVVKNQATCAGIVPWSFRHIRKNGLSADPGAGPVLVDGAIDSILKVRAPHRHVVGGGSKSARGNAVGGDG